MSLTLLPLATMTAELRPPKVLPQTPAGTRMIYEVASGTIDGERLRAKLCGVASADWLLVGPDGTGTLDVRSLVETDDGALVFIQYRGRVDLKEPDAPLYATPRFETGDARYGWLNKVQAVGKGVLRGSTLTYDLYELR
jgi:uncharacterized protein DUF3237